MTIRVKRKKPKIRLFLRQSWWALLLLLFLYVLFDSAIRKKNREIGSIQRRLQQLHEERAFVFEEQEDLLTQIHSQSDPAWVELVLMREFGLVPEGKRKIHFTE